MIDGYFLGWVFIFICILTIIHVLSNYTRQIFLWTLKISIALMITCWLGIAVYVTEKLDYEAMKTMMDNIMERAQMLRKENPNL